MYMPAMTQISRGLVAREGEALDEKITTPRTDEPWRPERAPKVSDAFRRGILVSAVTWSGRRVEGLVCDRDQVGLLLDAEGADGYVFLPWSSVEQVDIREVAPRRVKSLPG